MQLRVHDRIFFYREADLERISVYVNTTESLSRKIINILLFLANLNNFI